MFIIASTFARTGVIALGVLTAFGGMAMTAPLGRIDRPALPMSANLPIELAQGDHIIRRLPRGGVRGGVNRGWRGGGNWNGNRAWRGNGNWRGNRGWKGRHWNYGNRHYHDYDDDNVGIVTRLGRLWPLPRLLSGLLWRILPAPLLWFRKRARELVLFPLSQLSRLGQYLPAILWAAARVQFALWLKCTALANSISAITQRSTSRVA